LTSIEMYTARTQAFMFVLWSIAFLSFLFVVVLCKTQLDTTIEKLVYTMLGVIGAKVGEQSSFFFQRNRPMGIPDPTTTTTTVNTSSTTTPTPIVIPPGSAATTAPAPPVVIAPLGDKQ
jgi:hypothetical protein